MGAHGIRGLCRAILIPSCRNYYKEVVFIMNNETLEFIQDQLEYEFDEPKLLRQAFTRKSYSNCVAISNNVSLFIIKTTSL